MTNLGFVDIETTSLNRPFQDFPAEVWEVGLVVRIDIENRPHSDNDLEYRWYLPVTLQGADPESLAIGRFYERHPSQTGKGKITSHAVFAQEFHSALMEGFDEGGSKPHLVGNVVSFDEERLAHFLYESGPPYNQNLYWLPWHYHIVDVESMVAGRLGLQPPWKSEDLMSRLGIPLPEDRHDALVDARWARDIYDALIKPKHSEPTTYPRPV